MRERMNPIRVTLFALLLALLFVPASLTEVGAIAQATTGVTIQGPYSFSIIEEGDPLFAYVWNRHSAPSASRIVLNENGAANGDGHPSMAFNAVSGTPIVAWARNAGSSFDVVESHFENGAWTTPVILASAVTTTNDPEPQLAVDKLTGAVHVVYFEGDSGPRVMHTQAPANLASWSTPEQVSQIGDVALRPTAVIHQGVLTVAYESHGSGVGSTPRQIVVASSEAGAGFAYSVVSSTHYADSNHPALHTGQGTGLWIDWVDGTNDMAWSSWQPGSGWGAVQLEPFTDSEDRLYHSRGRIKLQAAP